MNDVLDEVSRGLKLIVLRGFNSWIGKFKKDGVAGKSDNGWKVIDF